MITEEGGGEEVGRRERRFHRDLHVFWLLLGIRHYVTVMFRYVLEERKEGRRERERQSKRGKEKKKENKEERKNFNYTTCRHRVLE